MLELVVGTIHGIVMSSLFVSVYLCPQKKKKKLQAWAGRVFEAHLNIFTSAPTAVDELDMHHPWLQVDGAPASTISGSSFSDFSLKKDTENTTSDADSLRDQHLTRVLEHEPNFKRDKLHGGESTKSDGAKTCWRTCA